MKQQVKISRTQKDMDSGVINDIKKALQNIQWGSLEIFIQNSHVVQITERNIKKVNHNRFKKQSIKTNGHNNNQLKTKLTV